MDAAATLPASPRTALLLDRTFDLYFRHPLPLILFAAVVATAAFVGQTAVDPANASFWPWLVTTFAGWAANAWGLFGATRIARADAAGESASLASILGGAIAALPGLLLATALYLLAAFGFLLLLIVPGIVFLAGAGFYPAVMASGGGHGWTPIARSRALMRGRWWRTVWRLLLVALPVVLLTTFFGYLPKTAPMFALQAALLVLLVPIQIAGTALIYLDLEARAEEAERQRARRIAALPPAPVAPPAASPAAAYAAPSHATFDPGAFSAFEHRGWQQAAGSYVHGFARLTRLAVEPLLDAAGIEESASPALLDVATGPGDIAAGAAARGAGVIAVDFSPGMLALARENHPELEFRVADAEALPFPDRSFDVVTMGFLVGHLAHPERALAEARRVLRPGGRLALSWWQTFDRAVGFGIVMDAVRAHGRTQVDLPEGPPFDQLSDPAALGAALEAAGFRDVRLRPQPLTWRVERAEDVYDAYLHGTVRTAGLLREQSPEQLLEIRAEILRQVETCRSEQGIALPMPCWIASGVRGH